MRYEPKENAYYCPEEKPLQYRGTRQSGECLLFDEKSNAPVSAEEALYPRSQPETICSLGGASATNSSPLGEYARGDTRGLAATFFSLHRGFSEASEAYSDLSLRIPQVLRRASRSNLST